MRILIAAVFSCVLLGGVDAPPSPQETDPERSVFAVITHKAGVGAAMAHNHLIHAKRYEASVAGIPEDPSTWKFDLRFKVDDLAPDDPAAQAKWAAAIEKAGIPESKFSKVSSEDREKIKMSMLGLDQLDAERYPEIVASLENAREEESTYLGRTYDYTATIAMTIRGKTVNKKFAVRLVEEDSGPVVEGVAAFRFSDFGIEPYSAMMGAVRNKDTFHVFVRLKAAATKGG